MKELSIEDKQLLLKDICARLPYGVFMTNKKLRKTFYPLTCDDLKDATFDDEWDDIPYLRPMSSMTDEERKEYNDIVKNTIDFYDCPKSEEICFFTILIDWLNAHHFDYRGLIEKGLALEAPEGMYKPAM